MVSGHFVNCTLLRVNKRIVYQILTWGATPLRSIYFSFASIGTLYWRHFGGVAPRRAKVERGIGFFWILHCYFIPPRRSLLRGAAVNATPLTAYALLIGFFYRFFASQLTKWPLTTLQTEFLSISGYLSRFDAVRKCRAKCANCRGSSRKCRVSCQNCRAPTPFCRARPFRPFLTLNNPIDPPRPKHRPRRARRPHVRLSVSRRAPNGNIPLAEGEPEGAATRGGERFSRPREVSPQRPR